MQQGGEAERKGERETGGVRERDEREKRKDSRDGTKEEERYEGEWLQDIPIFPLPGILFPRAPLASPNRVGLKQACQAVLLISVSHLSRIQPLSLTSSLLAQNTQTWKNRFSELDCVQGGTEAWQVTPGSEERALLACQPARSQRDKYYLLHSTIHAGGSHRCPTSSPPF